MSHHENLDLMREIRSFDDKGRPVYDPMPPSQYLRMLQSRDAVEKLMGWMFMHTVRYRPRPQELSDADAETFRHRTAYATNEFGAPLTVNHMAADFRWTPRRAQQVWKQAEGKNLVEKRSGALFIRGDVPVKVAVLGEGDSPTNVNESEMYKSSLPPDIRRQLDQKSAAEQQRVIAGHKRWREWQKEVHADAIMVARDLTEPHEVKFWEAAGIEKHTGTKQGGARERCWIQTSFTFDLPDPVSFLASEIPTPAALQPRRLPSAKGSGGVPTEQPASFANGKPAVSSATGSRSSDGVRRTEGGTNSNPAAHPPSGGQPAGSVPGSSPQQLEEFRKVAQLPFDVFHESLVERFEIAGCPQTPTRAVTKPLYGRLGADASAFLAFLTADLLRARKARGPGVLPSIEEEFLDRQKLAAKRKQPEPEKVTRCGKCGGSGLIGADWETQPQAIAAVLAGAKYCDCEQGELTRCFIEPELDRKAVAR